eukprot:Hpha_TRINITY_DN8497_c0_g2::TRINITY_DN8497_c0_g2_i1::g.34598::m.34598
MERGGRCAISSEDDSSTSSLRRVRWAGSSSRLAPPRRVVSRVGTTVLPERSGTPSPFASRRDRGGRLSPTPQPKRRWTPPSSHRRPGLDTVDSDHEGAEFREPAEPPRLQGEPSARADSTPTGCMKGARAAAGVVSSTPPPPLSPGAHAGNRNGYRSRSPRVRTRRTGAAAASACSPSPPLSAKQRDRRRWTPDKQSNESCALELSPPTSSGGSPRLHRHPRDFPARLTLPQGRLVEEAECRQLLLQREGEHRALHVRRLVRGLSRAGAAQLQIHRAEQSRLLADLADAAAQRRGAEEKAARVQLELELAREDAGARQEADDHSRSTAELEYALREAEDETRRRTLVEDALQTQLVRESTDRRKAEEEIRQASEELREFRATVKRLNDERQAAMAAARAAAASGAEQDRLLEAAEARAEAAESAKREAVSELEAEREARRGAEAVARELQLRLDRVEKHQCKALDSSLAEAVSVVRESERVARRQEERAERAELELHRRCVSTPCMLVPAVTTPRMTPVLNQLDERGGIPGRAPSHDPSNVRAGETVAVLTPSRRGMLESAHGRAGLSSPSILDSTASTVRSQHTPCYEYKQQQPEGCHPINPCTPLRSPRCTQPRRTPSPHSAVECTPASHSKSTRPPASCTTVSVQSTTGSLSAVHSRSVGSPRSERAASRVLADVTNAPPCGRDEGHISGRSDTRTDVQLSFKGFQLMVEDIRQRHHRKMTASRRKTEEMSKQSAPSSATPLWRKNRGRTTGGPEDSPGCLKSDVVFTPDR